MKRIFFNFYLFIVVMLLLSLFVVVPTVEHLASAPFRGQFNQYYQELVKGPLFLLAQDLQQHPESNWQERLQLQQPQFGYPLALVRINPDEFTTEEIALLEEGRILVSDDFHQFWQRIGQSEHVLSIGPFPSPGVHTLLDVWTWGIFLLLLGIAAFLWTLPFRRQLTRISRTAVAFGEGNFEVRAVIPKIAALAPLANSFNLMAERIQKLISSHKELTNAVSHELRTPITRLRFGMEMLESSTDTDIKARYADGIHRDLDDLDGLVNELLTYASLDRNTQNAQMVEQEVVPWLQEVLKEMGRNISAHLQQEIILGEKDSTCCFDPRLLRRALENLIQNASRYGNGLVKVTMEQQEHEILIHVDDDGPGIPATDREGIFEPFTRIDSSRSRESGGFGLGLAIVRRIADAHQGVVSISSSSLGGCRFSFRWPAQPG